jgi:hypothetical protein
MQTHQLRIVALLLGFATLCLAQDSQIKYQKVEGYFNTPVTNGGNATMFNVGNGPKLLEVYHEGTTPQISVAIRAYGDTIEIPLTAAVSLNKATVCYSLLSL